MAFLKSLFASAFVASLLKYWVEIFGVIVAIAVVVAVYMAPVYSRAVFAVALVAVFIAGFSLGMKYASIRTSFFAPAKPAQMGFPARPKDFVGRS
jgi:hypothetical protein